jgi:N-acetylglucosamine-6-phosphate deacetylase
MEESKTILEGIHYETGKVIRMGILNGRIFTLADIGEQYWPGGENRERLPVIAPGLVDLQVNGYRGVDFNDPGLTAEQLGKVSEALLETGVTKYCPTLITGPRKKITGLLKTFAGAMGEKGLTAQMIGGIHLEGPFISREEGPRGAHPKRFCLLPDLELVRRWQDDAGGRIRIITLAPELPGSIELISGCVEMGMAVAIGHTAAGSEEIRRAVDAGAILSTHLGNGCHLVLPRHPNCLWDQLAEDRLYATMIADGFHLPDAVLRVFMRSKGERAILVSDSMPYAGMEPGVYESPAAGRVRLTREGRLHREGNPGLLAGSAGTLLEGVQRITRMEGLARGWNMGSVYPSRLLDHTAGHWLHVGAHADLVLLENTPATLKIRKVYKGGKALGT